MFLNKSHSEVKSVLSLKKEILGERTLLDSEYDKSFNFLSFELLNVLQ